MRPGQNKRMRGRNNNSNNNNNRKGPNPLTRSYESNGPDVKIRGTAHHVAEKYLQLARDAQSSGDPVAAESYLQHAEHYFRLIASAQQAQMGYARQSDEADPEDGDDDDVNALPDRFASPPERVQPVFNPPQPAYPERQPYNGERQPYNGDRPVHNNGEQRPAFNGERHQDRNDQGRGGYDRNTGRNDRMGRGPRPPYREQDGRSDNRIETRQQDNRGPDMRAGEAPRAEAVVRGESLRPDLSRAEASRDFVPDRNGAPRVETQRREAAEEPRVAEPAARPVDAPPRDMAPVREATPARDAPALPAFITAPVRVTAPPSDMSGGGVDPAPVEAAATDEAAPRFPRRRRRITRAAVADGETTDRPADAPVANE